MVRAIQASRRAADFLDDALRADLDILCP
jgi:hypothetical protein